MKRSICAISRERGSGRGSSIWTATAILAFATVASAPRMASADEGGVSFWLPGFFGSLAAAPQQPGWSVTNIYYHTSVSAGGDVALAREFNFCFRTRRYFFGRLSDSNRARTIGSVIALDICPTVTTDS
jgi:hypothetical protein